MRMAYTNKICLNPQTDSLVYMKRGGGEKTIPTGKWYINRNIPIGEDAELVERMPYGGCRFLDRDLIIAIERNKEK